MSIAVICGKCSAKLNAPESAAGKRVKCPKCQNLILVPELLPAEFEVIEDDPQPAKKPPAKVKAVVKADVEDDEDEDERPRKKRRDDDDEVDDDDDRPRKKKKKAAASDTSMTRNIVGGVLLLVLLAVAGYVFYDRFKEKKDDTAGNSNTVGGTETPGKVLGDPIPNTPGPGKTGGKKDRKQIGTPGQPTTLNSPAGFKVTFPGPYSMETLPQRVRDRIGLPLTLYVSEDAAAGMFFGAAHVDFAANSTAAQKKSDYDKVVASFLEDGAKSGAPSRRTVTVGGRNWEEISFRDRSEGIVFRALQGDRHIYVLIVGSEKGIPTGDVLKRYFDSYELTN